MYYYNDITLEDRELKYILILVVSMKAGEVITIHRFSIVRDHDYISEAIYCCGFRVSVYRFGFAVIGV